MKLTLEIILKLLWFVWFQENLCLFGFWRFLRKKYEGNIIENNIVWREGQDQSFARLYLVRKTWRENVMKKNNKKGIKVNKLFLYLISNSFYLF